MVASRSETPHGVSSGFIRTIRSRPLKSTFWSHSVTVLRADALLSGVTESSRSSTSASAARSIDLPSILSLAPGTKCTARRSVSIFSYSSCISGLLGGLAQHHRRALAAHHDLAALIACAMLEDHDAPGRT